MQKKGELTSSQIIRMILVIAAFLILLFFVLFIFDLGEQTQDFGPNFAEVVKSWKKRRFPQLAFTTRVAYEKLLRLYFGSLMACPVRKITPARVDEWLDELKDPDNWTMQSRKRKDFRHELSLLSTILGYYDEFFDDEEFRFPIKRNRHKKAVKLGRGGAPKPKDLPESEFLLFRDELKQMPDGEMWAALATIQYFQAYRISEIAGLHYEDIDFDWENPYKSRIRVVRSVCWPRLKGHKPFIQEGFKNVDANDGMKEQPMFPETFAALAGLYTEDKKGLVFHLKGEILEYRKIQSVYNRAFQRCGLPYTSTHVLRHGVVEECLTELAAIGGLPGSFWVIHRRVLLRLMRRRIQQRLPSLWKNSGRRLPGV